MVSQLPPQPANLRRVGNLLAINDSDDLTSLARLKCLEQVGQLHLFHDLKRTDLFALANIEATGLTSLDVLAGVPGGQELG